MQFREYPRKSNVPGGRARASLSGSETDIPLQMADPQDSPMLKGAYGCPSVQALAWNDLRIRLIYRPL